MARQLILCCDGTNNNLTGRTRDTNVAQLVELLTPDSQNQLLYYDPGVGSAGELPEANPWDQLKQKVQRLSSMVYGKGIYENIAQAYLFLMRHWQPGDQIFLYGFSRGAFTARSVGGLVTQFGILRPEMEALVPTLLQVYFLDRQKYKKSYNDIKVQISALFTSDAGRVAPVWFVGVWDTVASVGMPLLSREITAIPTIVGKRFCHVRQALALDEYRRSFNPRPYFIRAGYDYAREHQSIQQHWFSGAHSDVGGGMVNRQAGLSQQALLWMVQESAQQDLRLRPEVLDAQGQCDPIQVTAFLASKVEPPEHTVAKKVVHDPLYTTPWWALGGMCVRDPRSPRYLLGKPAIQAQPAVESPTVQTNALGFPDQTAWHQPRALHGLLWAALIIAALWLCMGAILAPIPPAPSAPWYAVLPGWQSIPASAQANGQFSGWQLAWWLQGKPPTASLGFPHGAAGLAVLLDFAFIAAYGYLLARAVSWAFARIAGLRRVSQTPPVWLNRLGMAACLTVLGDVAENLLTWAVLLTASNVYVPIMEPLLGICMSLAALAKWLGVSGSTALVVWACFSKHTAQSNP